MNIRSPLIRAALSLVAASWMVGLSGCGKSGSDHDIRTADPVDGVQVATTSNDAQTHQIHLGITPGGAVGAPKLHRYVVNVTAADGNPITVDKTGNQTARITIIPDPNHPGPHQIDLAFAPDSPQGTPP